VKYEIIPHLTGWSIRRTESPLGTNANTGLELCNLETKDGWTQPLVEHVGELLEEHSGFSPVALALVRQGSYDSGYDKGYQDAETQAELDKEAASC
jgi:hypothetical protein